MVSKRCSFGKQIHWFRVDGRPIREQKYNVPLQKYLGLNGRSHKLALLFAYGVTLDLLLKSRL